MLAGLRAAVDVTFGFLSAVVPTFDVTLRDAIFGAAVFDLSSVFGALVRVAATFDVAVAAVVVAVFLIGAALTFESTFCKKISIWLEFNFFNQHLVIFSKEMLTVILYFCKFSRLKLNLILFFAY